LGRSSAPQMVLAWYPWQRIWPLGGRIRRGAALAGVSKNPMGMIEDTGKGVFLLRVQLSGKKLEAKL